MVCNALVHWSSGGLSQSIHTWMDRFPIFFSVASFSLRDMHVHTLSPPKVPCSPGMSTFYTQCIQKDTPLFEKETYLGCTLQMRKCMYVGARTTDDERWTMGEGLAAARPAEAGIGGWGQCRWNVSGPCVVYLCIYDVWCIDVYAWGMYGVCNNTHRRKDPSKDPYCLLTDYSLGLICWSILVIRSVGS